jgi:hypothetical protein
LHLKPLNNEKMPKIFTYFGFIFYFFSNEHKPIHVHVKHGEKETVFELILDNGKLKEIRKREKRGINSLNEKDTKTVIEFIQKYNTNIIDKWIKFFVLRKKIRCTKITNKI